MNPGPIVSLLPAATEMVCALGAGPRLVGRSHECDYPPWVTRLPALTHPRLDPHAPPALLDRTVRELVRQAASLYAVDDGALAAVRPQVIVTQTQCEVCAVSVEEVHRALQATAGTAVRVASLGGRDLAGVYADITAVGAALDADAAAAQLVATMQAGLAAVRQASSGQAPVRTVCLEWLDPPMTGGHWLPELVACAGGRELLVRPGMRSRYTSFDEITAADPDCIVVLPCGYGLATALEQARAVFATPAAAGLRATRIGRVYVADGNQHFNRPGPRLVESAEILAEMFHRTDDAHRAAGAWTPLTAA